MTTITRAQYEQAFEVMRDSLVYFDDEWLDGTAVVDGHPSIEEMEAMLTIMRWNKQNQTHGDSL